MAKKPDFSAGIAHIEFRLDVKVREDAEKNFPRLMREKPHKVSGPLIVLSTYYRSKSLYAWFAENNLSDFRRYAYAYGRVYSVFNHLFPAYIGAGASHHLLYPLISNCMELISWHSQFYPALLISDNSEPFCLDPSRPEFNGVQTRLAMAGDWEILRERADFYLANKPAKSRFHEIDNLFYKALSLGDVSQMRGCVLKMLAPKVKGTRVKSIEWGLEQRLFNPWATIFCKLAKLHGYDLDVESDWIPNAWIDCEPLESYCTDSKFIDEFDLFSELTQGEIKFIRDISSISPRDSSESRVTFLSALKALDH